MKRIFAIRSRCMRNKCTTFAGHDEGHPKRYNNRMRLRALPIEAGRIS